VTDAIAIREAVYGKPQKAVSIDLAVDEHGDAVNGEVLRPAYLYSSNVSTILKVSLLWRKCSESGI
jgi:hypothetical protein